MCHHKGEKMDLYVLDLFREQTNIRPVVLAHITQKVDIFCNKLIFSGIGPEICVESLIKTPRESRVGIPQNPRWRPEWPPFSCFFIISEPYKLEAQIRCPNICFQV